MGKLNWLRAALTIGAKIVDAVHQAQVSTQKPGTGSEKLGNVLSVVLPDVQDILGTEGVPPAVKKKATDLINAYVAFQNTMAEIGAVGLPRVGPGYSQPEVATAANAKK